MRFLHPTNDELLELSLDDAFILPQFYEGGSRLDVDLRPSDFPGGSHPIVSANMNGVTGKRMAETMARYGGLGVLPQDMEPRTVERIVKHIKAADVRYDTPLSVTEEATLRDVQGLILKRSHGMVVVVDADTKPIGLITPADLRERDQYTPASKLMTKRPLTIKHGTSNESAWLFMEEERLKAVPVVDPSGKLVGISTRDDAVRTEILEPALSGDGRLMVAAALGLFAGVGDRAVSYAKLGVDCIVLDTAHGHQRRMLEAIGEVRWALGDTIPIVAGNVCTESGTEALIEAGADIVKVNVGPGAMCTTRMQTAVGRPTLSSVMTCARTAARHSKHVWADGGVRHPRDVALYLAAGASRVMVGTALSGTYESPGDIKEDREGYLYKENYGMASARAVKDRTGDLSTFEQAKKAFFREGISSSRIYLRSGSESVGAVLIDMITGLRSALTYTGASDLAAFHENVILGVQTASGFREGTPHGKVRR